MASVPINLGSQPVNYPGYPTYDRDENGNWVRTERYWVKNSSLTHSLPANGASTDQFGAAVTDPDGNTLKCRTAHIEPGKNETNTKTVELTYARTETSLSLKAPVDNPRSVRMTMQDIPIDDERLLQANGGPFTAANIADAKAAGHASLPLYSMEYTYTELDASFAWTQAAIIASLQAIGAPDGMGSATASKWELTGKEIDETENETIIRSHWRYAAAGVVPIKT